MDIKPMPLFQPRWQVRRGSARPGVRHKAAETARRGALPGWPRTKPIANGMPAARAIGPHSVLPTRGRTVRPVQARQPRFRKETRETLATAHQDRILKTRANTNTGLSGESRRDDR